MVDPVSEDCALASIETLRKNIQAIAGSNLLRVLFVVMIKYVFVNETSIKDA